MRRLTQIVLVFMTIFLIYAPAATAEMSIKYRPFEAVGLVVGKKLKFDEAYTAKYKVPVPAPFEFIVPSMDDVKVFAAWPPETGTQYVKLSFATKEKELIENLRFVNMTIPMADKEKRIAAAAQLIEKKALPMAVKGYKNPRFIGLRQTEIRKYPVVEAAAACVDTNLGTLLMWLTGIINPESKDCIMAFTIANPTLSEAKTPQDIGKKGIAPKVLSTFRYIKP